MDFGEQFRRIGAREENMRFTATYSWKDEKKKDMSYSVNSKNASNVLNRTWATTVRAG